MPDPFLYSPITYSVRNPEITIHFYCFIQHCFCLHHISVIISFDKRHCKISHSQVISQSGYNSLASFLVLNASTDFSSFRIATSTPPPNASGVLKTGHTVQHQSLGLFLSSFTADSSALPVAAIISCILSCVHIATC